MDAAAETQAIIDGVQGLSVAEERKRKSDAKKQEKAAARVKARSKDEGASAEASTSKASAAGSKSGTARSGRPGDSPEVQLSKALSKILRHGAASQGLVVRADGFFGLSSVLARPAIAKIAMRNGASDAEGTRSPTVDDIRLLVDKDAKGRFELKEAVGEEVAVRATQGHSMKEVTSLDHVPVTLDTLSILAGENQDESTNPGQLPPGVEILHGTTHDAWQEIQASGGLSRMKRNHIHLAKGRPGASGVISGMRASAPVILHIDIVAALQDGIPFVVASNGAVLSSGAGDTGVLDLRYIRRAEEAKNGRILWERPIASTS